MNMYHGDRIKKCGLMALIIAVFAPIMMPQLQDNPLSSESSRKKNLEKILQTQTERKGQVTEKGILKNRLMREDVINRMEFLGGKDILTFFSLIIFSILLFMTFICYPQILISYIHRKDGKKRYRKTNIERRT